MAKDRLLKNINVRTITSITFFYSLIDIILYSKVFNFKELIIQLLKHFGNLVLKIGHYRFKIIFSLNNLKN